MSAMMFPALDFFAVTPSDTDALPSKARSLFIGGAGNVSVINASGTAVVFVGVQAGTVLPIQTSQVTAADTSATDIIALM